MKCLATIVILIMLTGCDSASTIIEKNEHLCDDYGGVKGLSSGRSTPRMILCNDRTVKWTK
jgi:hypothetical protein